MLNKYTIVTCIFIMLGLNSAAQSAYEKGYIIKNDNKKVDCLIKAIVKNKNPTTIKYRLTEKSEIISVDKYDILGFQIYGDFKYMVASVGIDRSSLSVDNLSINPEPEFNIEKLFLRVLIEGDPILYEYRESNFLRFFFKPKEQEIEQLIYKRYKVNEKYVDENTVFRSQIKSEMRCKKDNEKKQSVLYYTRRSLMNYFESYYECTGQDYHLADNIKTGISYSLQIRPGINIVKAQLFERADRVADFDTKVNVRFGVENEFFVLNGGNRWSFLVEGAYQKYNATTTVRGSEFAFSVV